MYDGRVAPKNYFGDFDYVAGLQRWHNIDKGVRLHSLLQGESMTVMEELTSNRMNYDYLKTKLTIGLHSNQMLHG